MVRVAPPEWGRRWASRGAVVNRAGKVALRTSTLALLTILGAGCGPMRVTHITNNPIVGRWEYKVPGTNCVEVHQFQSNNIRTFISAAERGQSQYTITPKADANGFYVLEDTITSTNGLPDCSGEPGAPVGDHVKIYVRFSKSRDEMLVCRSESISSCFGVFFRRIQQQPL